MPIEKINLKRTVTHRDLLKIRSQLGKTQQEMADIMGAPYTTYREWEGDRDDRKITPAIQKMIKMIVAMAGTEVGKEFGV